MGPGPDEAPPRGGRLGRFARSRRAGEDAGGGGTRTMTADPADDTTVVQPSAHAGDEGGEALTRISATGPPTRAAHAPSATGADAEATRAGGDAASAPAASTPAGVPADRDRMHVPSFSPLAVVGGLFAAWGLAALAAQILQEAGVGLGQGFGIASGQGVPDALWDGVWLLAIQAVAWIFGGYVAARMARNNGTRHALLAWVLAMLATGADAIMREVRDGYTSVLAARDLPSWVDTGLDGGAAAGLVFALFALGALVAALAGGGIGSGANALARRRARA